MISRQRLAEQSKLVVRGISSAFGTRTSKLRMLPDFLIIGAQRCGTTSLFRYLAGHPAVVPPPLNKGVHYFDTNFAKGPLWYQGQFPLRRPSALGTRVTGEASPYYLFHPCAAQRITSMLPDVKLIVMLRNPRDRAFSAYNQELGRGFEHLSFEDALLAEARRLEGEADKIEADPTYNSFHHQHHAYVARGRYAEQLATYFSHGVRERLLVMESEAFFSEPEIVWGQVLEFLELEHWHPPAFERHNARPSRAMSPWAADFLEASFEGADAALALQLGRPVAWMR